MKYRVTIYCPDHHLSYDGRTPDRTGIGGGVTIRIRLARALAKIGHQVTLVGNCLREEQLDGVHYLPLRTVSRIETEIAILTSSAGDTPDLSPALELDLRAHLRVGWVHGRPRPGAIHEVGLDYVCAVSNFVRRVARDEWPFPPEKLFVCYNGVEQSFYRRSWFDRRDRRDPYRLLFSGHPDKGLDAALGVLWLLRERDARFELHIYGGDGLYGAKDKNPTSLPGTHYHGTVGQRELYRELKRSGFALNLQARLEPFGIALAESMAAGCIVLASPVGAYPEIIRHGYDGFFIDGVHTARETQERAADLIWGLVRQPELADYVRKNAQAMPWDMETLARAWEGHWDWALSRTEAPADPRRYAWAAGCPECGGAPLPLADGYHCTECGLYHRDLSEARGPF